MSQSRSVIVKLDDWTSLEVATGHQGRGVFITLLRPWRRSIEPRFTRVKTMGIGAKRARRLAEILRLAAEASDANAAPDYPGGPGLMSGGG